MAGKTIEITKTAADITVAEGLELPDFDELEREIREDKQQTLAHLRDVARVTQKAQSVYVTLAEVAEIVGVDKSNLRKMVKKKKLGHSYGRVPGSPQRQMIFTKEGAEIIIKEYLSGQMES